MDAADNIPSFLDPLLDSLSSALPPSIYDALVYILSHAISFSTSLFYLLRSLIMSHPSSWDAQTIIPPLITVLGAYLALVSFYRTTGWMIRTTFAFLKWGTILCMLAAGAGFMMGNANANGGNGVGGVFPGSGILPAVGGMILQMINGEGRNAADGRRSSRSRTQRQQAPRPKPWESWDRHQEWQYNENEGAEESSVHDVMEQILSAVGRTVRDGGWWETAKGAVDDLLHVEEPGESEKTDPDVSRNRQQPRAKTKDKSKTSSR